MSNSGRESQYLTGLGQVGWKLVLYQVVAKRFEILFWGYLCWSIVKYQFNLLEQKSHCCTVTIHCSWVSVMY